MSTTPAESNDYREQLSAWHDGALRDEAARFVTKRLLQDEALRAEVGRWQVIGDALRRQPQQRLGIDIAARIATAVDAEGAAAHDAIALTRAASHRAPALRWMATAAAVGMVAVLMWPAAPTPDAGTDARQIASAPGLVAQDQSGPAPEPRVIVASSAASRAIGEASMVASSRNLPGPVPLRVTPSTAAGAA